MEFETLIPDWPAPRRVRVMQTTRRGGRGQGAYAGFNLGDHVGDDPAIVAAHRQGLADVLPAMPHWLEQVHGTSVSCLDHPEPLIVADAVLTRRAGRVCVVMTADCLPILMTSRTGSVVAAIHAGWRGLCQGVIESTVSEMACPGDELLAWLGPAIGPGAFEVGDEVRQAFLERDAEAASAFAPGAVAGKWWADLYHLARLRLAQLGVTAVYGGERCTYSEPETFFSYRRDRCTGRMASLIWIDGV